MRWFAVEEGWVPLVAEQPRSKVVAVEAEEFQELPVAGVVAKTAAIVELPVAGAKTVAIVELPVAIVVDREAAVGATAAESVAVAEVVSIAELVLGVVEQKFPLSRLACPH